MGHGVLQKMHENIGLLSTNLYSSMLENANKMIFITREK